jgi:CubicO group peptidase (beta-lactamase class C family)
MAMGNISSQKTIFQLICTKLLATLCIVLQLQHPQNTNGQSSLPETGTISRVLDTTRIGHLNRRIADGEYGKIRSLIIYKGERLEYERYYNHKKDKYKPTDVHSLQSVTKSITSLLVGILLDKGYLKSIEERVVNFFPEYKIKDSLKSAITIKDLLLMASGISWNEDKVDLMDAKNNDIRILNNSKDYIQYYLSKPMDTIPGTKFRYSGGCSITLGEIIKRSSGMTVEEFARKFLFEPLGIREYKWRATSKSGQHNTGGGLCLLPKDLARIGLLLTNNGQWNGQQIVSAHWISESFKQHIQTDRKNGLGQYFRYGYQWWIVDFPNNHEAIAARGWGDQRLVLMPALNMVIVINAANFLTKSKRSVDELLLEIIQADPEYDSR